MTEEERARRVAELDVDIEQCNADLVRYERANAPDKVATVVNQREALRRLRAELLAAEVGR